MTKPTTLYGFYRPHKRVTAKNELVNQFTGEIVKPPGRTKQEFVLECDINNILKMYKKTGIIQHVQTRAAQGQYLDLPSEVDFQASLNAVIQAEEAFASLPSKLRSRFGNDPAEFLAFCENPNNLDELRELGLAKEAPPPPLSPNPPPEPPKQNNAG